MKKPRQVLAIDIGTASLKLAVLEILGNHVRLLKTNMVEFPVPPSQKKEEFIKASLYELLTSDTSAKQVYIVLSTPYVELLRVEVPIMPLNELPNAVKWKIKDKISFKIEDAVISTYVSGEVTTKDGGRQLAVIAAAMERKELDVILSITQELHLTVVSINAVPFCLSNILSYTKGISSEESAAFVEVGAGHTYVSIYKSKKLMFTRNIPISSSEITDSMCGVLVSDKGRVELNKEEAEDIKKRFGMPIHNGDLLDNKIPTTQVIAMMRPVLERLASEVKRTFTYYTSELGGDFPAKLYLSGGGARLKNLDVFLKEELKIDARYLGLPENIKNEIKEDNLSILCFLGLVGAVLPFAGAKVNLLPPEFITEKKEAIQKVSIRMIGFTVMSILILSYVGVNMRVADYKKRLEGAKAHKKILQKIMYYYDKASQFSEAINVIKKREVSAELVFKEISNIVPNNIILDGLIFDFNVKSLSFRGTLYAISPVVEDELTRFMEAIEDSGYFKEANLVSVQKLEEGGKQIANFEITCDIQ